jgi:protein-L-isoaspartate(D-aspartate) O-methyltransferase
MIQSFVSRGITDSRVLDAMGEVPREKFVPGDLVDVAYTDAPLPIGLGQTISQPYIVAYMCEVARLTPEDVVLDIGTGSGYAAAVLSRVIRHVYTIERLEELSNRAEAACTELGYRNITYCVGDGSLGWKEHVLFDAIITTAAAPAVPKSLLEQLAEGGRLIIPVGTLTEQRLLRVTKKGHDFTEEWLGYVRFVPLLGEEGM